MHNNTEEEKTFQQPQARGRCFDVRMVSAFEENFCGSRMSWNSVTVCKRTDDTEETSSHDRHFISVTIIMKNFFLILQGLYGDFCAVLGKIVEHFFQELGRLDTFLPATFHLVTHQLWLTMICKMSNMRDSWCFGEKWPHRENQITN